MDINMEETFSEKMIDRFGICGLILIGVTAWLVFALILYGILSVTGVIVTEVKEPEQVPSLGFSTITFGSNKIPLLL